MRRALVIVAMWAGAARAEPALTPIVADAASCLTIDTTPGASMEAAPVEGALGTPVPWTELAVDGDLLDSRATVLALLEPTLQQYRTSLSAAKWPEIAAVASKFGYQLVGHTVDANRRLVLHLAPLPMVRKVDVDISQSLFDKLFDDEVRRRMRVRTGSYLPWEPIRRQCALIEERQRIEDFLHDEGYFDSKVTIVPALERASVKLLVRVDLGDVYHMGRPTIAGRDLELPVEDIQEQFLHKTCVAWLFCFGNARFTRSDLQDDIRHVKDLFHKRGYPAVRVQSSFDPKTSFDRRTRTVNVIVTIDQRRKIDYKFDGNDHDAVPDDQLREKLTFDDAGSSDDLEAASSARAIETFLQERGYFDARVTETRQSLGAFDRITFRIDQGKPREVRSVAFVGNSAIETTKLEEIVATKEVTTKSALFGNSTAATSVQLATDIDRIVEAYRRAGYRDARVSVSASPSPAGLGNAALTAALLEVERGDDLYVRYTIDEGAPTQLADVEIVRGSTDKPLDAELCARLLHELAGELAATELVRGDPTKCTAPVPDLKFREDDVAATKDRLRDFLFKSGRPRAVVEYTAVPVGPHRVAARYAITKIDELKIGKVVIRGNFKTHDAVIFDELGFREGELLTTDALANGARRLRNTGLFDAVNIDMPDLENTGEVVNAVVRVEERYDHTAQVDLEGGYSSVNGIFGTVAWSQRNLFGLGLAWTASATAGQKILDLESTFRIPNYLLHHLFTTDFTGLVRQLDTPRFGLLTTEGATVAASHVFLRPRTATSPAHTYTWGILRYDFRLRTRNVDVLRPIGANMDDTQVAISTRTGSIGMQFDWDQRVDRRGNLAPLAPEDGFRLDATVAYAATWLAGDDQFIKVSASGSRFVPIGKNLVLRADLRYDQGIPLGGAVLLPEVERFFAGGDDTVRGYADDRLATEIVQTGVPPVANLTQIRVIPAGGNIRVLGSLDAQVRIWWILAGALFADAGMITNQWSTVTTDEIRPSVGMGLRFLTPFGTGALEYAVPLHPHLGDDPRGRIHFYFAARAQF